jgi:hypothetical protein
MIEDGTRTGLPSLAREKALAVARIAGQGVSGVKVARARSAASVRNSGGDPSGNCPVPVRAGREGGSQAA